jgi:hypothetical protein
MMATYVALWKHLLEEQRYLVKIFGLMGPEEFLKLWLQEALKEKITSKELAFQGNTAHFWGDLENMHRELFELTNLDQKLHLHKMDKEATDKDYLDSVKEYVSLHEGYLMKYVGGRDELEKLLEKITDMDFHKQFMQELESECLTIILQYLSQLIHVNQIFLEPSLEVPRSVTGYKLQFLESRELTHLENEDGKPIFQKLGLPIHKENDPEEIDKWLEELEKDISNTMEVYVKRDKEEKNLMHILKPEGFESLMNYLKPTS